MALSIPISELSTAIDRPESLIRIAAKSRDIEIADGCLALPEVIAVLRIFMGNSPDEAEENERLRGEISVMKGREQELIHGCRDVLKENEALKDLVDDLRRSLAKSEARAERFETMLFEFSKSLAHLVDQRDRIVATHLQRSRTQESILGGKAILLLCDPIE